MKEKFEYTVNGAPRGLVTRFRAAVLDAESQIFQSWLRRNDWNVSRTARKMGISREYLSRKIAFFRLKELEHGRKPDTKL